MSAFPKVLEEFPNARLIIAGANHHTKAGYWESIRDVQPKSLPIEFRGYVPEEAIPELFETASLLIMPYDSATGSSGPAHQACEYGIPIVCADITDFRGMAESENMAIRFYQKNDSAALAEQILTILRSPEIQMQMAEHNYEAGVAMSLPRVVNNYLRWFRLMKCKKDISTTLDSPKVRRIWSRIVSAWLPFSPGKEKQRGRPTDGDDGIDDGCVID